MGRELAPGLSVSVRKARHSAGHPPFVLDVSLEFSPGFTILCGPSGAGKSTLLDCIAGLTAPDDGRIAISDRMLFDSPSHVNLPAHQRAIAYVFQSASLFPHLSVEENILYGIVQLAPAERKRRLDEILAAFRIEELHLRRPSQISGGEAQRVELARSLVSDPRGLLLDEPLTGLDDELRAQIIGDLQAWRMARNIPIIYVTHSMSEARALDGTIVTLRNGMVVER
ncbi:MAG TPA: ATP-binding cassette domain-containing protein [Candidatus Dormibacteraeota bacterium]|nr:ATP-binding cassette domain-containing protein [Candidatus Dormibacteraeota bacterium]